jgi:hypothetical protein
MLVNTPGLQPGLALSLIKMTNASRRQTPQNTAGTGL